VLLKACKGRRPFFSHCHSVAPAGTLVTQQLTTKQPIQQSNEQSLKQRYARILDQGKTRK
jgi:hypothetical protein